MLELDLLLLPFVEHHLRELDHADQLLFQQLLDNEDQDLFAWLVNRTAPPSPGLVRIASMVRDAAASRAGRA